MFSEMLASAIDTLSKVLEPNGPAQAAAASSFTPTDFSVHFFLQLAIIILTCRIVGKLGQKFLGQPQVVGEMIAGVILGGGEFTGGRISPIGAVVGALTLTLAGSFLSFLRISPDWQIGAQGGILIIVLALRLLLNRLESKGGVA